MARVAKAERSPPPPRAKEPGGRVAAPLTEAMAATPLGRLSALIPTSPVMQARAAAMRSAFGAALDPPPPIERLTAPKRSGVPDAPVERQKQGRVKPTLQLHGIAINDDDGLEREREARLDGARKESPVSPSGGTAAPTPPPLQRKLRIAETQAEFDTGEAAEKAAASESKTAVWSRLNMGAASAKLYTVKTVADLTELAEGKDRQVLWPLKHVIGESHRVSEARADADSPSSEAPSRESEFEEIKKEWPNVAAVAEGRHKILETGLALKHKNLPAFTDAFQSQSAGDLPLENYHAAALGRLISYLTVWNGYQEKPRAEFSEQHLFGRAKDLSSLYFNYENVSLSVYQAGMDKSVLTTKPKYPSKVEEAYDGMRLVTEKPAWKIAKACFDQIAAIDKDKRTTLALSTTQIESVRNSIADMMAAVAIILGTSAEGRGDEKEIKQETTNAAVQVRSSKTMSNTAEAFKLVNPTRERFMAEEITTAPVPSLVKVGFLHTESLKAMGIPLTRIFSDAKDFRNILTKDATDLM